MCPKICVNSISGANREKFNQGGQGQLDAPYLQQNAGGNGFQGRRRMSVSILENFKYDFAGKVATIFIRNLFGKEKRNAASDHTQRYHQNQM